MRRRPVEDDGEQDQRGQADLAAAVILGAAYLRGALRLLADAANGRAAISLFRYSISYLTLLFGAVAADAIFRFPLA